MPETRRSFLRAAGIVAIGAGVAGCTNAPGGSEGDGNNQANGGNETSGGNVSPNGTVDDRSQDAFALREHSYFEEGETVGVRGTVENVSETTFELVTVHVAPRTEAENTAGKVYPDRKTAYRDTLAPGNTWDFEVAYDTPDVESFDAYGIWVTGQENP
jgi:hypothetical protein